MLRPLIVTENFPPDRGGMAQSCDRIVRGLRARGLQVDVVHLSRRHHGLHVEQHERGRLWRVQVDDDPAHALNVLWHSLSREPTSPSHVLAFGGFLPMLSAPVFAAWLEAPLITLLRGNDFDTGIFSARRGFIVRDALQRSRAVAVVSKDHQRKVARLFPQQHVAFVPNGIDHSQWALLDIDRARAHTFRTAEVAQGRRVIGLFGHLKQKKGGLLFLDALEGCALAARVHLLIVGEVEPALLARLTTLQAAVTVTHIPFLDRLELLPWYAACDLIAIPSLYDGMPNVVLEAGALGIPVLASTAGGLADLLVDGENALTFAPGDGYGCARALDAALRMADAPLSLLGRNLQTKVRQELDQLAESRRYHELLSATASRSDTHEGEEKPAVPASLPFSLGSQED